MKPILMRRASEPTAEQKLQRQLADRQNRIKREVEILIWAQELLAGGLVVIDRSELSNELKVGARVCLCQDVTHQLQHRYEKAGLFWEVIGEEIHCLPDGRGRASHPASIAPGHPNR